MAKCNLSRKQFIFEAHLQYAWNRALLERLEPHPIVEREGRILELVMECDPTATYEFVAWLSAWRRRQWLILGVRHVCSSLELFTVHKALERFVQVRHSLPPELRDIGRFKSTEELLLIDARHSAAQLDHDRKRDKNVAIAETRVLFEGRPWRLLGLCGINAAMWWGRGTKWCTAARQGNKFEEYAQKGPLLVVISRAAKYQLSLPSGEFRDASDTALDLSKVVQVAPDGLKQALHRAQKDASIIAND